MTWFTDLTGVVPETPENVAENLRMDSQNLVSKVNGRSFAAGRLSLPRLAELRTPKGPSAGPLVLSETVADVQDLHMDPDNAGAFFQVASQFNLLEMVSPLVSPDEGVGRYEHDHTQGPACAIACGAGTIFRNYFTELAGGIGQTAERQINCLADFSQALQIDQHGDWSMQNGYVRPGADRLSRVNRVLAGLSEARINDLRGLVRVGLHEDTEVTLNGAGHFVTQIYCSAMPVAYSDVSSEAWRPVSCIVQEAAYEATLLAAAQHAARTGNRRVFLTLLGGGAFGNAEDWIVQAVLRALKRVKDTGLDVRFVSHGMANKTVAEILARWAQAAPAL